VKYQGLDGGNPYVYSPEGCQGLRWPETCLKKMTGLVSGHEEGFTITAIPGEVVEREYSYTYFNARMNLTGHGWLGFDRREVKVSVGGLPERTITTTYEPVARYRWDPAALPSCNPFCTQDDATQAPYVYPLAGLAKTTIIDDHSQPFESSPLENARYDRRTRIDQTWEVARSAFDRPFPRMGLHNTAVFDRDASGLPFEEDGLPLAHCSEALGTDGYGNVVATEERCQTAPVQAFIERNLTITTFVPDTQKWLISNPEFIQIQRTRVSKPSIRHGTPSTSRTACFSP
jgi:hypothetical protein